MLLELAGKQERTNKGYAFHRKHFGDFFLFSAQPARRACTCQRSPSGRGSPRTAWTPTTSSPSGSSWATAASTRRSSTLTNQYAHQSNQCPCAIILSFSGSALLLTFFFGCRCRVSVANTPILQRVNKAIRDAGLGRLGAKAKDREREPRRPLRAPMITSFFNPFRHR